MAIRSIKPATIRSTRGLFRTCTFIVMAVATFGRVATCLAQTAPPLLSQAPRTDQTMIAAAIQVLADALNQPNPFQIAQLKTVTPPADSEQLIRKLTSLKSVAANSKQTLSSMSSSKILFNVSDIIQGDSSYTAKLYAVYRQGDFSDIRELDVVFSKGGNVPLLRNLSALVDTMAAFTMAASTRALKANSAVTTKGTKAPSVPLTISSDNALILLNRFNSAVSHDSLRYDLFSRPYDVCPYGIRGEASHNYLFTTDVNWDRIMGIDYVGNTWLQAVGTHGSGSGNFSYPAAITVGGGRQITTAGYWYYVADVYNNRIRAFAVDDIYGTVTDEGVAAAGFSEIRDVASSPSLSLVAALDAGGSTVKVYRNDWSHLSLNSTICSPGSGVYNLNKPTAICFGRDPVSNLSTSTVYVADNGNRRIVAFDGLLPAGSGNYFLTTSPGVFPDNAYLTSIDADNFGNIYVVDHNNSVIHLFSNTLQYIGTYGSNGEGDKQLLYPNRFKIAKGEVQVGGFGPWPPLVFGGAVVTEAWGGQTGIRMYKLGCEITSVSAEYFPGGYVPPSLAISWHQTGTSGAENISIDFTGSAPGSWRTQLRLPGDQVFVQNLSSLPDTGITNAFVTIELHSVYDPSIGDNKFQVLPVHVYRPEPGRITVLQAPAIDDYAGVNSGEKCLYPSAKPYKARSRALDSHGGQLKYVWTSDYGSFFTDSLLTSGMSGQPTTRDTAFFLITSYTQATGRQVTDTNLPIIFTVYVTDRDSIPPPYDPRRERFPFLDTMVCKALIASSPCGLDATCRHSAYCNTYGGCPMLYVLDGRKEVFVNNLLPQSEESPGVASDKSDVLMIPDPAIDTSGQYRFAIREEEQELSSLKSLNAAFLDLPISERAPLLTNRGQLVIPDSGAIPPVRAVTDDGGDVTSLLAAPDGNAFAATSSGHLDLEYDLTRLSPSKSPASTIATSYGGGANVPGPDKPAYKISGDQSVAATPSVFSISALNAANAWTLVDKRFPRRQRDNQITDLSDFVQDGHLKVRLEWSDRISVDYLPYLTFRRVADAETPLSMARARHSRRGEISHTARGTDRESPLSPGEQIELTFAAPPVAAGYRRVLLFHATGRYDALDRYAGGDNYDANFSFDQNYPNPFNPSTSFRFSLPKASPVRLVIFNVLGQQVVTVMDEQLEAGPHTVVWNGTGSNGVLVSSGVYFARLTAGDLTATRKMVVVK